MKPNLAAPSRGHVPVGSQLHAPRNPGDRTEPFDPRPVREPEGVLRQEVPVLATAATGDSTINALFPSRASRQPPFRHDSAPSGFRTGSCSRTRFPHVGTKDAHDHVTHRWDDYRGRPDARGLASESAGCRSAHRSSSPLMGRAGESLVIQQKTPPNHAPLPTVAGRRRAWVVGRIRGAPWNHAAIPSDC